MAYRDTPGLESRDHPAPAGTCTVNHIGEVPACGASLWTWGAREITHGDLTSLAPHETLPEILVVPREKTPTGAAARGNP